MVMPDILGCCFYAFCCCVSHGLSCAVVCYVRNAHRNLNLPGVGCGCLSESWGPRRLLLLTQLMDVPVQGEMKINSQ